LHLRLPALRLVFRELAAMIAVPSVVEAVAEEAVVVMTAHDAAAREREVLSIRKQ
jgi:hypothetical protein